VWAQIIRTRLKPGTEDRLGELLTRLRDVEQPDSGLIRTTAMRDQHDPLQLYLMVVFGSEEQARAREADPRRAEGLAAAREIMGEILDGSRDFIDLDVVEEVVRRHGGRDRHNLSISTPRFAGADPHIEQESLSGFTAGAGLRVPDGPSSVG